MNVFISLLLIGGPLSEITFFGNPNVAKISLKHGIRWGASVFFILFVTRYQERPSIKTKSVSPLGNGHKKSMYTVSKFSLGISRINRGCGGFGRPVAWRGIQLSIADLTCESIKGNQTFSRIRLFVLTMPWWPTWAKRMACARKLLGITMRVSRKMMFLLLDTVSSSMTLRSNFSSRISMSVEKFVVSMYYVCSMLQSWVIRFFLCFSDLLKGHCFWRCWFRNKLNIYIYIIFRVFTVLWCHRGRIHWMSWHVIGWVIVNLEIVWL